MKSLPPLLPGILLLAGMSHVSSWAESPLPTARPTEAQYAWHELERIMFICLDPCTWQGREYDNHTTALSDMVLPKLDTDQWCRAARSWGAGEILFVAKHTGGFCWWQTETTEYSVQQIAWKKGQGDLLRELAGSCRTFGLQLGVYIYPGDDQWGAGIGSGGRTADPSRQEAYNEVLRQQWTEVLTRYGKINELWFDGSCIVPLGDILSRHAPGAVVFQGPHASLRWPGSESGILPYPAWNALSSKDLETGVATAQHSRPDGDAWAPLEADTTLYDHYWFWSPSKETHRKSLRRLMEIYYKSVGRGGVLLLNGTPNTDGLIPEGDLQLYREFGDEIRRCFEHPVAETSGTGTNHVLRFETPTELNQVVIMEDYRQGERIRAYTLTGQEASGRRVTLNTGSAVGRKHIVVFRPHVLTELRLHITNHVGEPRLRALKAYHVQGLEIKDLMDEPVPVSQHKPAVASATHSPPYSADKINDGKPATRWGANDETRACWIEIDLLEPTMFNRITLHELADRITRFQVEYRNDQTQAWSVAYQGASVDTRYEATFSTVHGRFVRLHILEATFAPTIWEFQVFGPEHGGRVCGHLTPDQFRDGEARVTLDLSEHFTKPGQYRFEIIPDKPGVLLEVAAFHPRYNGQPILGEMVRTIDEHRLYNINRTAQIVPESRITLEMTLRSGNPSTAAATMVIYGPDY